MIAPACSECSRTITDIDARVDAPTTSLALYAPCGHRVPPEVARRLWDAGMRWALPLVDGAALIEAERKRQRVEEGFSVAHDAEHDDALPWAAWCYLDRAASGSESPDVPQMWPWEQEAWKPEHSPLRMLVIAGALIAAEIDRRLMLGTKMGGR